MEGWKQRLLEERNELKERKDKLEKFIHSQEFQKLDCDNQHWLSYQLGIMERYLYVLEIRIRLNNIKEN